MNYSGHAKKSIVELLENLLEKTDYASHKEEAFTAKAKLLTLIDEVIGRAWPDEYTKDTPWSWDDFIGFYEPVRNNEYGTEYPDDDGLESILIDKKNKPVDNGNVWSVYEVDGGIFMVLGVHTVNVIGYIETTTSSDEYEMEVSFE